MTMEREEESSAGEIVTGSARLDEYEACHRLAYEVFCEELGTLQEAADHDRRVIDSDWIADADLLCARIDGLVVGTVGVLRGGVGPFPPALADHLDFSRFEPVIPRDQMAINVRLAVQPEFRNTLVPFLLIAEAARHQARHGIKLGFCDCQPHLLNLYTNLGFLPYAPTFDQGDFGLMVPLVVPWFDFAHLRSVRSPLLKHLPAEISDPDLAKRFHSCLPEDPPIRHSSALEDGEWAEAYSILARTRARQSVFEGFSEEEVATFVKRGQFLRCSRGQLVVPEGQSARTVYVILEGEVEVRRGGVAVARMSAGECFGEVAFLLESRRVADVFACSDVVRLVVLNHKVLERLMRSHSELAARFLLNLARSLAVKLAGSAL